MISVQALMTDWGKKQPLILRTFSYRNMDVFTIQSPSFNAQIRSHKKLLGIMRFSEGLKIEIWGAFFWYLARFVVIWACLRRNDVSFYAKQHVVRSISRDIFQIMSDEIFISSEKIEKKSDKIAKCSRIRAKFVGRIILNLRSVHSFLPSLLDIPTKIRPTF